MDMKIESEEGKSRGRFFITLDRENEAEITYSIMNPHKRIVDHTGVPEAFEGQGIAKELVLAMLNDARQKNIQYIPLCPYVAAQLQRHPDWNDVFKKT